MHLTFVEALSFNFSTS